MPIGFARSSAGEYTFSIFAVVGIALVVSWLGAVIFSPLIGAVLLKAPKDKPDPSKVSIIVRVFRSILLTAMRMRWVTIGLTLACFVGALLLLPHVPRQFFPASDRTELMVDLRLPQNTSIYQSGDVSARFDAIMKDDPDVERWSTYIGRGAIRFYLPLNVELPNEFFAQAVVIAKDVDARLRLEERLETKLAEQFPDSVSRVAPLELGPPVGWPVQYRVSGPDVDQVRDISMRLAQIVSANPDTKRVNFDWMEPARMVRVKIDQDQARLLGLSSQALASRAERGRDRNHGHPGSRRHLPRRRHRAGHRRAACLARQPADASGAAAERQDGAAQPVRHVRLRSGISADLAPGPRPDADRAVRRPLRRIAGGGGCRAGRIRSRLCGPPCRPATTSPSAVSWRRVRSRCNP